jgi:hypothetical protein
MFNIGVDLGQTQDHTAPAIIERPARIPENRQRVCNAQPPLPLELLVRRADCFPLGAPYPRVVEKLNSLTHTSPSLDNASSSSKPPVPLHNESHIPNETIRK